MFDYVKNIRADLYLYKLLKRKKNTFEYGLYMYVQQHMAFYGHFNLKKEDSIPFPLLKSAMCQSMTEEKW